MNSVDQVKAQMDAYGVAVRAGVITPQPADEDSFRQKLGLPPMSNEAKSAWKDDKGVRRPITLVQPGASPGQQSAPTEDPEQ